MRGGGKCAAVAITMQARMRTGVLLSMTLCGCDLWSLPEPTEQESGSGSSTGGDEFPGSSSVVTTQAATTETIPETSGGGSSETTFVTLDVEATAVSPTTGTSGGTEGDPGEDSETTTEEMCVAQWEICDPGDAFDDNCDGASVCDGVLQAGSVSYGPNVLASHVVPAGGANAGEFHAFVHLEIAPDDDTPGPISKKLYVSRFDVLEQTMTPLVELDHVQDMRFGRGGERIFVVTKDQLGAHSLYEYRSAETEFLKLNVGLGAFDTILGIAVTAERVVLVGHCDVKTCVGTLDLANPGMAWAMADLYASKLTVDDLLVYEDVEEKARRLVVLNQSEIVRADLPIVLPEALTSVTQKFGSMVQLSRLAWDATPGYFYAAGTVAGHDGGIGDAALPVGDPWLPCYGHSKDLLVARFAVAAAGSPDPAMRSDCANEARPVNLDGLMVDPTGDVLVAGSYYYGLSFSGSTTDFGLFKVAGSRLFVARLTPGDQDTPLRWLHTGSGAGSSGGSIALDPSYVVIAARMGDATLTFQGTQFPPNLAEDGQSGVLLALRP